MMKGTVLRSSGRNLWLPPRMFKGLFRPSSELHTFHVLFDCAGHVYIRQPEDEVTGRKSAMYTITPSLANLHHHSMLNHEPRPVHTMHQCFVFVCQMFACRQGCCWSLWPSGVQHSHVRATQQSGIKLSIIPTCL